LNAHRRSRAAAHRAAPKCSASRRTKRRARRLFLIGTPAQCIEELNRRAKEWGVGQFIFLGGAPETTRRLANEVLPHVGP
jgi:alkanesulfonate monooxygenase SsuD/methylene tetrahydromethanopterin reductase-like flavin-dependent oxidoreductase (luciferase family)